MTKKQQKQEEQLNKIVIKFLNNGMNEEDVCQALCDYYERYPDLRLKYDNGDDDGEKYGCGYDEEEIFGKD